MKIIMSPAKEMAIDVPVQKDWVLTEDSQKIVSKLEGVTKEGLKKLLKVSDALLEENWVKIQNFQESVTYHAMDLYQGLAFRSFKQVADWKEYRDYAVKHIRILSALYGAISPEECVKPYRLDLTMNLKVEGETLKRYWKERIVTSFEKGECIVNLASSEFSSLFNKKQYDWVDVDFFEKKEGVLKQHSTISKKARGKMAAWMMSQRVQEKVEIQNFDLDGFRYDASLSKENHYCFVKEV
ncbi:peroxide stress protein YaaA [Granulicatella sp.]